MAENEPGKPPKAEKAENAPAKPPKTDYAGNAKKQKDKAARKGPAAEGEREPLESVVTEPVIIKKRSFGRRFKDWVHDLDAKTVTKYVVISVIVPGIKSVVYEAGSDLWRRTLYKNEPMGRRGPGGPGGGVPRTNYATPVVRSYSERSAYGPGPSIMEPGPRHRPAPMRRDDFYLASQAESELVLERMGEILEQMEEVTLRDLYELMGRPPHEIQYTDQNYGWTNLMGTQIFQTRDGYYLNLPPIQVLR